ncbi:MAG: reprolysin-like metallopeptidase [Ferruginibacter sp.]
MKKNLPLTLLFALFTGLGFSQTDRFWSASQENPVTISKNKAVSRSSFPTEFKLFKLNIAPLRLELFRVVNNQSAHITVISLPNADGGLEQFEIFEASNFEPALQAQFPEIRAFSGKGITDKYATLKLSLSPQGIQTMVFRTDKANEFIEAYSQDQTVYAAFRSNRSAGQLPWTCSTVDSQMASSLNGQVGNLSTARSGGDLKTLRLAQSCNAEYSNYFGATSASQVGLVLAAFNATLTRCNGVYEKDLALHLNLIANTSAVIYYNASTDPYSTSLSSWNGQLQSTLTSVIGEANYDIGHMFGASGGGGNAGCIGCICVNGSKGSGITSPADGIPQGDNFDIDYVVHEVGHQLGANHTFSKSLEGTGVNKEVGSGITIMGYAGITSQDVAPHSIDIFHEASIAQIQANLLSKTCPATTNISANNATPVVAAVNNYTIPISTPFALTGSATDANAADVLTYCWEQNDNSTTSGASSVASPTKTTGPNWLSFSPTTSPIRLCPKLSTILAGLNVTPVIAGGDAGTNIEALSSVGRTLNFRLTVRDNAPYSSTAPVKVGQSQFTDMVVTVSASSGPFAVTVPNTAVSWAGASTQNITWSVAGTTAAPVSCANVKISFSTDGGQTFPTILAASTPNDGTESLVIPNTATTTARIKIEAVGNIFFDISNTNFIITAGSGFSSITTSAISPLTYCAGTAVTVPFTTNGTANAGNVFTAQLSNAAGSFASPVAIGTLTTTAAGTISAIIPAGTTAGTGYRIRVVSSNPLVTGSDNAANISINVSPTASVISAAGPTTFCSGESVFLSGNSTGGTWSVGGGTSATLSATTTGDYFTTTTNGCGSVTSNHIIVTVNPLPTASVITAGGPTTFCSGETVLLSGNTTGGIWSIGGGTTATLSASATGDYFTTTSNGCGAAESNHIAVTVTANLTPAVTINANPGNVVCAGTSVTFTASPTNGGTPPGYNWIKNGVSISGGIQPGLNSITISSLNNSDIISCQMTVNPNAGSCVSPATVTSNSIGMTVNSVPEATTSPAGSATICAGTNILISAGTGTGFSYQWRKDAVNIGGSTASSYLVSSEGSYDVIVTNAAGCSDISPAVVVTVNPLPTVSFSGLASSYTVNAATAALTGAPSGGTFSGPGITGNSFNPATAGVGGPYTITYTYTNANGCTNTSNQQTTVTAACTVPARPGTISTVGGTAKVCPGDVKTYAIAAVSGATSYTWTAPPGGIVTSGQGSTSATVSYNSGFTTGDSLRVTANNSCGSSLARALKINRNSAASTPAAITGQTEAVCNKSNIPYSVSLVPGNSYSWSWNVTGATIASGQGSNAITADFLSTFVSGKLSVTATNACGASSARTLTVYAKPPLAPSISGLTSVCAGQQGVAYSISPLNNASSYTWYAPSGAQISDGSVTSTGTSLSTTATSVTVNFSGTPGLVRVKGINVCAAGSVASTTVAFTCKHITTTTEQAMSNTEDPSVFPNPSNGNFRIRLDHAQKISTTARIEVTNEFGQIVYQSNTVCSNGIINLDLSAKLTTGVYFINCTVNGIKTVKKLMISK